MTTVATMNPAQLARKAFVAEQIAVIMASGHSMAKRWANAVLRAGEAFSGNKSDRLIMLAKCESYETTLSTCNCEAGANSFPCKHRAFLRLSQKWATGS